MEYPKDNPRCKGCPECVVIFDEITIYAHIPDKNSSTCRGCEVYKNQGGEQ